MKYLRFTPGFFLIALMLSCGSNGGQRGGATDSTSIARGKELFNQNCSSCHQVKLESIGPPLGGLPRFVPAEWMKSFIKNPQEIIESGDDRAQRLIVKFNVVMPSFGHLADKDIDQIISYLYSERPPDSLGAEGNLLGAGNPIPEVIPPADIQAELKLVAQFPFTADELPKTRITKLDFQPNSNRLFVVDLRGTLYSLTGNLPEVYMDLRKLRPAFIDKPGLATGFGSFAFHPEFASNGLLYTTHVEPAGTAPADFPLPDSIKVTLQWVVTEWKTSAPAAKTFAGEGKELFRIDMATIMHGVQEIAFNPLAKRGSEDYGLLYICIGDGGAVETGYPFIVHSPDKAWGSVLRIDPRGSNSKNGHYGIPSTNPFSQAGADAVKEIYASGFRNPHRITWSRNGGILVCNIGHSHVESLNLIKAGGNYGWPEREGTFVLKPRESMGKIYPLPPNDSSFHFTYPVAEYDHDEGKAISGGYEYWGNSIPELKGKYLFGDIPTGRLFYVDVKDIVLGKLAPIHKWELSLNGSVKTLAELCGTSRVDVHFGRDQAGEIYIMTKPDGKLYKLAKAKKI